MQTSRWTRYALVSTGWGVLVLTACGGSDRGLASTTVTGPSTGDPQTTGSTTGMADPGPLSEGSDSQGESGEPPRFDVAGIPDAADGTNDCVECDLFIDSQASGAFTVTGPEVFGTAVLGNEIIYAIGTYGAGRFIATADSSLPFNEQTDCPLHEWLAGTVTPDPAVLWFGWTDSDGPIGWTVNNGTAAGVHLPDQYIGDPALLAQDYDVVMYLEASRQFDMGDQPADAEMQTLLDYVAIHGGGLYVSSEFADAASGIYLDGNDLASVNRLMQPLGVESMQVMLTWGGAVGSVGFDCFPPPAG